MGSSTQVGGWSLLTVTGEKAEHSGKYKRGDGCGGGIAWTVSSVCLCFLNEIGSKFPGELERRRV